VGFENREGGVGRGWLLRRCQQQRIADAEPPLRNLAGEVLDGNLDFARLERSEHSRQLAHLREASRGCTHPL
jgi:hypothetical protein